VPDPALYGLFVLAALALLAVPGPAVLYVVSQSIEGGRRAGLASVVGVHCGTVVHVAAAAIGLSSLLVSSARAYDAVKYAGAAYLVFLGVRTVLGHTGDEPQAMEVDARRRLMRGATVQILNPKTALFFFAFLPQFVDADAGAVGLQILVLGLTFMVLGLVSDGAYAIAAGALSSRLRGSRRAASVSRYASGTILIGLGALAAVSGRRQS
jgi:threonine/homoserine/homoserine lactone efflux protein